MEPTVIPYTATVLAYGEPAERRTIDTMYDEVTVLLVRMTWRQLADWQWLGGCYGNELAAGWEMRDREGTLLGLVLQIGSTPPRLHIELYDPDDGGDFRECGEVSPVLSQAVRRLLEERWHRIDDLHVGRDTVLDPEPITFRAPETA